MNAYHTTTYQLVFGTKYRRKNMTKKNRHIVYGKMYFTLKRFGCHVYRINGVADHVHIVMSVPPKVCISDVIREVKSTSSLLIRQKNLFEDWVGWQRGYFLASYSAEARHALIEYVKRQEIHHGECDEPEDEDYRAELRRLLDEQDIPWDEAFLD